MMRQATVTDLDQIEEGYHEHFLHEKEHGAFTVFQEGVYPTRKDAEKAFAEDALYVYEENGTVAGSIILNGHQPKEYEKIDWPNQVTADKVMVIHLLSVRPHMARKGIGSSLVNYAFEIARQHACAVIRLDTGAQNKPAVALYTKQGFQLAGTAAMQVGGAIPHDGHLFFEKKL